MGYNDFLKTNSPEVWTREQARVELFTKLETQLMTFEAMEEYGGVLKMARMILRLQMETMEEKTTDKEGKTVTLVGVNTTTFKDLKKKLDELEIAYTRLQTRLGDPAAKANARMERLELVQAIQEFLDLLFHNNTVLGLNYRKKNDPMKAAYS